MIYQAAARNILRTKLDLPSKSIRHICSRNSFLAKPSMLHPLITGISSDRNYSKPSTAERAQVGVAEGIRQHEDPFKDARLLARDYAKEHGYDLTSIWEENIAWGHLDSFRHLNNVHYVRFFETSRMHMMYLIGLETNGTDGGKAMLEGLGVSIILKSIDVKFKRPVTYPDNLVIMQRPHNTSPSRFHLSSVAYSLAQRAPVATSEAICVWYDYDVWKKCDVDENAGVGLAIAKRAYKPEHKD
ncbi:unnamed protein product [Rhizoctonia solani]|uniref:Thioesterase domain-containing protein n=1 Tax=Rhizoctonia solani TaxID=456999 RepID=A0A8H3D6Z3_9AGAM|nr:unnamed protein product [Rhizoctonia solani]CAE7154440.1 unnamed protein product [Rhizoctonia solani]